MPKQNFANLSIRDDRYQHIRKNFESHIEKHTTTSFTQWVSNALDKAVIQWKMIKKDMPELSVIDIRGKKMILDSSNNKVVEVLWDKKTDELKCSEKQGAEKYMKFAVFSPEYPLG